MWFQNDYIKVALSPFKINVLIFLKLTDTKYMIKYVYNKAIAPLFQPK